MADKRRSSRGANSRSFRGLSLRSAGRVGGAGWIALAALACSEPPAPLEARCLDALAYRSPAHGEIESIERTPTEAGTAVAIRYRMEDSKAVPPHQYALCEFATGDRWELQQMIYQGEVLSEPDLALVNSDLLLQDLAQNPERFAERAHIVIKPPEPVADPEAAGVRMPADSRLVGAPSQAGSASAGAPSHVNAESVAVRSQSAVPPPASAPAVYRTEPSAPAGQIPSPSSGGSD